MEFRFSREEELFRDSVRYNEQMAFRGAPTKRGTDMVGGNRCRS